MRAVFYLVLPAVLLVAAGLSATCADQISDIIGQATLPEYQSYLRVLTGVDVLPGHPGTYLTNRYSQGTNGRLAGAWIKDEFTGWGYSVTEHIFNGNYAPNVIAERLGTTRPQDIYIISAHYDTVSNSPGCDDNGSGTASVLTAARILSSHSFAGTVRFIAFSGEEQGLVGSDAYAHQRANAHDNILGVINLDMILHPGFDNHPPQSDYDLDLKSNTASLPLTQYVAQQFAQYTTIPVQVHSDGQSGSDQYSFWQHGFPALGTGENTSNEIWSGSNSIYHTANDTLTHPDFDWPFGLEAVRGSMAGLMGLAGVAPEPGSAVALLLLGMLVRGRVRHPRRW